MTKKYTIRELSAALQPRKRTLTTVRPTNQASLSREQFNRLGVRDKRALARIISGLASSGRTI